MKESWPFAYSVSKAFTLWSPCEMLAISLFVIFFIVIKTTVLDYLPMPRSHFHAGIT